MSSHRVALDIRASLGEGPVWCPREQVLFWLDSRLGLVNRFDPATGENRSWRMPEPIGSMALRERGGIIAALASGIALVEFDSGAIDWLIRVEHAADGMRFNDGKCDRRGRFWTGTMVEHLKAPALGALYRVDADHSVTQVLGEVRMTNGIGWSPDDAVMYFTDTAAGAIYALDYDIATGAVANQRVFATTTPETGWADGLTVDAEGGVWSAGFGRGRLNRYAPDGRLERVLELPVAQVTSIMFGGPDLGTLYVTTAGAAVRKPGARTEHRAGMLLAVDDVGVRGLPEPRFAG
jgi:sugar lactone lactonase YvrE